VMSNVLPPSTFRMHSESVALASTKLEIRNTKQISNHQNSNDPNKKKVDTRSDSYKSLIGKDL
jgi:hypothetical protein